MRRAHILRRAVHMATPVFIVYYLLPDPLWPGGVARPFLVLVLLVIVLLAEGLRLHFKFDVVGMRAYEGCRVSAAAWAAVAIAFAICFFPIEFAAPVLIGMGWVDPFIGELRVRASPLHPLLPLGVYFVLALGAMAYFRGFTAPVLVSAPAATVLAVAAEGVNVEMVDDDFLMIVVPVVGIAAIFGAFSMV